MTNLEKFFTDHNARASGANTVMDMVALRRTRGMSVRDVAELIAKTIDGIPLDFGDMTAVTGTQGYARIRVTVQSVESTESNAVPIPIAVVYIGRSQHVRIAWCRWGES